MKREKLTTPMVTHSVHQAVSLGARLIMMNRGRIPQDFQGAEKRWRRVDDLLTRFDEVRRAERLDELVAQMLDRLYVGGILATRFNGSLERKLVCHDRESRTGSQE